MQKKELFRLRFSNDENVADIAAHSEIELIFIIEGTVDIQVEQKFSHLQKDDILVINPDRRRSIAMAEKPLMMHLMIDYSIVRETFQGQDVLVWCDSTSSEHEKYNELRKLLKRLARNYVSEEKYVNSFKFLSDCYEILHMLCVSFVVKAADVQWNEEGDRFEERLFKINNYINTNYDQPISIKDLSEKLFLSIGYLSRFFKKNYGMNFASYLNNVRLVHATDELLYTNISVTRVAYDCGFTSAAIFNKAFKKAYDVTPTEFRKQAEKPESNSGDLNAHEVLANYISQAVLENEYENEFNNEDDPHKKIEGNVSVTDAMRLKKCWADALYFSDASNLLYSSVREHLISLKKYLNFKYVRFCSIFSRELFIRTGQQTYDFNKIDSILDFVLEQGLKPFIELGMKPRTMHYEIGDSNKERTGDDFTISEWESLMMAFMRHLSTRYGQSELDEWRMELWFDEDLRTNRKEGEKYLQKFEVTYKIVKAFNENIQVGGYGIRMDFGGSQRLLLYKLWKEQYILPDFISLMFYAYERGSDGQDVNSRRSTDDDNFRHLLSSEKEIIREAGLDHLPLYISEWNLTPSVRNAINDTCFKGAYVVKNILDVFGEVDSMCFGAATDLQYSSYDTQGLLFGGTGLIAKEGIMKPSAFALGFMNEMYDRFAGKGDNYLITTDGHDNYSIVCHNQQKLNDNYYLTPETKVQKDNIWKYFDRMSRLNIQLHLKDLKDGTYRVKIYRINNQNGSVLDIWKDMNYENDLTKNDIAYLKRMCEPNMTIRMAQTVNGSLMIDEELAPNEIAHISIRYIP